MQDAIDALENQFNGNAGSDADRERGSAQRKPTDAELDELRSELEHAGLSHGGIDVVLQSPHTPALALRVSKSTTGTSLSEVSASLLEIKGLKLGDKKRLQAFLSTGNKKNTASERGEKEL